MARFIMAHSVSTNTKAPTDKTSKRKTPRQDIVLSFILCSALERQTGEYGLCHRADPDNVSVPQFRAMSRGQNQYNTSLTVKPQSARTPHHIFTLTGR